MDDLYEALEKYLQLRRALGFALVEAEIHLRKFLKFLEQEGVDYITTELARRWATAIPSAGARSTEPAARLRSVRLFAQYRSGTDSRTEIPPKDLLPCKYTRAIPYIYPQEEVRSILRASRDLRPLTGLRGSTMATLFGLLAVTGLRVSEALALDEHDVDLEQCVIHVRFAKFGKSRLVPIHPSTATALDDYRNQKTKFHGSPRTTAFFVDEKGKRLPYHSPRYAFVVVSRRIGLRGPTDSHGPRIHDLRHTFAVRTLIRWYREGCDVGARELPKLSTFMGHVHWSDTYWYITAVPELMALAVERLEKAWGGTMS